MTEGETANQTIAKIQVSPPPPYGGAPSQRGPSALYNFSRLLYPAEESAAGSRQCVLSWILKGALAKRSCVSTNPSALEPGCCAVAKQSKPRWGFEAHERARFAGWRRSLCAAKRALSEVAGPFSVPFGVPKGTPKGSLLLNRGTGRRVPGDGNRALIAGWPRSRAIKQNQRPTVPVGKNSGPLGVMRLGKTYGWTGGTKPGSPGRMTLLLASIRRNSSSGKSK